MALEFEQAETVEGGSTYCSKPGTYHVVVTDYVENPETKNGGIVEGGFKISCEIVDGTNAEEVKKTVETTFYPPAQSHKDGGEFALKRMTKFYLAINRGVHQPGTKAMLSYETVVGRQFVVEIKEKDSNNGKKYMEFSGLNTWHVDDVAVDGIPLSQEYLEGIPADLRMISGNDGSDTDLDNV
jgi:hypothetical protein